MSEERIKRLEFELEESKKEIRILKKTIKNITIERKASVKEVYDSGFREGYGKAVSKGVN